MGIFVTHLVVSLADISIVSMLCRICGFSSGWSDRAMYVGGLPARTDWQRHCRHGNKSSQSRSDHRSSLTDSSVAGWYYRHIDRVPTDVGPSLVAGPTTWNSLPKLFTPPPSLHVYSRHFFFQSTSVYTAH